MEFGDEPVGLHQLVQGEGGIVDTHLGLGDVHEGVEDQKGDKVNATFFYLG